MALPPNKRKLNKRLRDRDGDNAPNWYAYCKKLVDDGLVYQEIAQEIKKEFGFSFAPSTIFKWMRKHERNLRNGQNKSPRVLA